ncbi:phage portal protein [Pediococcus pentosaceus]
MFRKGGAKLGMIKSLGLITDDERIAIPATEYERITIDKNYYADIFPLIHYKNSYGYECHRKLRSLNIAKMAAKRLASIIFNEQCDISLEGDETANQVVEDVMINDHFYLNFEEFLEKAIALGGGAARPYVEGNKIKIAWINADQFYPLHFNTNEINEAAIASKTTRVENKMTVYYTLLEFHQWKDSVDDSSGQKANYEVTYELYRSESDEVVGQQVPLNTLQEYAELSERTAWADVQHNLFAYFKTPGTNNITFGSPLGLGIIDNSINIIHAINQTHDQFVWEVKMGKRRVAVPAEMLRPGKKFGEVVGEDESHPMMFDSAQNVYEAMYGMDDLKITDLTSDIRNTQYQEAMDYFVHEFENQIGLSSGTFSTSPDGIQTATEVVSNNSMTYQTRSSYITQVEKFINELINAILELAKCGELFEDGKPRWDGDSDKIEVNVHFDDGVFVDKDKQMDEDLKNVVAGVLSKATFLKRNYGLSDDDIAEELGRIQNEQPEPPITGDYEQNAGFGKGDDDE